MKKRNILLPIVTSAAFVGTIGLSAATLSSCSTDEAPHLEAAITDVNIIGNNMAAYMQFILRDELAKGQTIEASYGDTGLFNFMQPEVNGRLVTVPIYWLKVDTHDQRQVVVSINFTCKNKNTGRVYWNQTIEGTKVTYLPYCTLNGEEEITSQDISGNRMTASFVFDLPNGIPSTYPSRLTVEAYDKHYEDNLFSVESAEIDYDSSKLQATVTIVAQRKGDNIADGDSYKCDIQISCMYADTDIPIWISSRFMGLSVAYNSMPKKIPVANLEFQQYGTSGVYSALVGIKGSVPSDCNALEIPAIDPDGRTVLAVGKEDGSVTIEVPKTITKLVFAKDSSLTYFEPQCFKDQNSFAYIDVSSIGDDAEGLEQIQFKTNSFANWSKNGTIVWGTDFSQYKRHMLMMKLYQGGLTQSGWYKIVEVSNESQLREACATGSNVKLVKDITIARQVDEQGNPTYTGQVNIEKDMLIDLNGYTVTSQDPIYNNEAKEFGVFGIWAGADVVVTDSYDGTDPSRPGVLPHSGSVKAFDQRINGLNTTVWPTTEGKEDACWDWATDLKRWKPREARAFYIRTDTPTKAETSLWILAGNFYGNCTTIFNCNGSCWIEESFKSYAPGTEEELHLYAPQFHTLSPYREYTENEKMDKGATELLNCDDTESVKGTAYFEVYGGKFYGVPTDSDPSQYHLYYPSNAEADTDWEGHKPANWLASHRFDTLVCTEDIFKDSNEVCILVTTKKKPV